MAVGLKNDLVTFEFPDVHRDAVLQVTLHRTLRIPDDGHTHALPPGLGRFPLKLIDDVARERIPAHWPKRGGVVMPMWQSEAMWISFSAPHGYPFAVKIAAGKVNAVDGKPWKEALDAEAQDWVEAPKQPWIDGWCVRKGVIRQFVAMPLGSGHSVEEQVTGKAEHGGIQILARPLKAEVWDAFRDRDRRRRRDAPLLASGADGMQASGDWEFAPQSFAAPAHVKALRASMATGPSFSASSARAFGAADMGLAAGGSMKQEIHAAVHGAADYAQASSRCFVAIANSLMWQAVAGEAPPTLPPTAADYARRGLPWFDHYADGDALDGSPILDALRSVVEIDAVKGGASLPENETVDPKKVKVVKLGKLPRSGARAMAEPTF